MREKPKDIIDWLQDIETDLTIKRDSTKYLPVRLTDGTSFYVAGVAQLQVRDTANIWKDVGYYSGNSFVPIDIQLDSVGLLKKGETIKTDRIWIITETLNVQGVGGTIDEITKILETVPIDIKIDSVGLLKKGETISTDRTWIITETISTSILSLPYKGTPYRYYNTLPGTIITISQGQSVRIYGYYISALEDDTLTLKYTNGDIIAILPSKGVAAMNLINIQESNTTSVYLDKVGSGYALAVVYAEIL